MKEETTETFCMGIEEGEELFSTQQGVRKMAASNPAFVGDAHLLRLSGVFLDRLGTDPRFAESFDKDPAAALQDLFPELKFAPKNKIAAELASANIAVVQIATSPHGLTAQAVGGFWRSIAKAVVTAAAQALVKALLSLAAAEEPRPE